MICESSLTERAAIILDEIKKIDIAASTSYRDASLECGKLLHDFVLEFLRSGDDLTQKVRLENGVTRARAIKIASESLEWTTAKVNERIHAYWAVKLLSDGGDIKNLGLWSINRFCSFVERKLSMKRCMPPGSLGPISVTEEWQIKKQYDGKAQKLFQEAVNDGHGKEKVKATMRKHFVTPKGKWKHDRAASSQIDARRILEKCAAKAAPRDIAEVLFKIVNCSSEPFEVAQRLQEMLSKIPKPKPGYF